MTISPRIWATLCNFVESFVSLLEHLSFLLKFPNPLLFCINLLLKLVFTLKESSMSLVHFLIHFHWRHLGHWWLFWHTWKRRRRRRRGLTSWLEEVVVITIPLWCLSFQIRRILPCILEFSLLSLHLRFHLMFSLLLGPFLFFLLPFCVFLPFSFLKFVWVLVWTLTFDFKWDLFKSHLVLNFSLLKLLDFSIPLHFLFDILFLGIPELFTGLSWVASNLLLLSWLFSWKTCLFITRESGLVIERTTRSVKSWAW